MVDTIRQLSTLQGLLATNGVKDISGQDLRDFLVSVAGARWIDDVSADTVLTDDHNVVTVDASGGNKIITLPTAVGRKHRMFTVKKRDSANTWVRLLGDSSQTFDGHIQEYLTYPGAGITVLSDNANWQIITPGRGIRKQLFTGTANATFNTSNGEENVTPTGLGILTLPPNFYRVGRDLRVLARGFVNVTATPTLAVRLKLNGVTIATTGNMAMAAVTNNFWRLELVLRARAIGAGGNIDVQGSFAYGGGSGSEFGVVNTAVVSLDTTANQPITLHAQFSASSASNAFTVTDLDMSYAA